MNQTTFQRAQMNFFELNYLETKWRPTKRRKKNNVNLYSESSGYVDFACSLDDCVPLSAYANYNVTISPASLTHEWRKFTPRRTFYMKRKPHDPVLGKSVCTMCKSTAWIDNNNNNNNRHTILCERKKLCLFSRHTTRSGSSSLIANVENIQRQFVSFVYSFRWFSHPQRAHQPPLCVMLLLCKRSFSAR